MKTTDMKFEAIQFRQTAGIVGEQPIPAAMAE